MRTPYRGERRLRWLPALLLLALLPGAWASPGVRWVSNEQEPTLAIVEASLPDGLELPEEEAGLRELLQVRVGSSDPSLPQMAGTYSVDDRVLRFRPRFPLTRGLPYRATLQLGGEEAPTILSAGFTAPPAAPGPRTRVTHVAPGADLLPFNLLKFYLHFSAPMTRGRAYQHVILRDQDGRRVVDPFLELPEELWNPEMTRLTILLDPGRIKRGLLPNEILGAVLEEGQHYTLTINPAWEDAAGQSLEKRFEKRFRAGPPDYQQPDPKKWRFQFPVRGSRDPLRIVFPAPLDEALVWRLITVRDHTGAEVPGRVDLSAHQSVWEFRPSQPWKDSRHQVRIDHRIEDLAGNSIERRFEENLDRHPEAAGQPPALTVRPFTPGPSR